MISKKNKALTAGVLAAAMSATAIVPAFASAATQYATENDANTSYAKMFESLYADVITNGEENGYLAKKNNGSGTFGVPYHCVETLCVEAPDYGHETTSEAMSYISWITAMHDVLVQKNRIDGSTGDFQKGWKTMEALIPGWSVNAYGADSFDYSTIFKQDRLKADTATEEDDPAKYPAKQNGVDAINPIYNDMKTAYGSDNGYYLMHWLADVDDWYGFGGSRDNGSYNADSTKFVFINTFQRGEQESCFETVPQPCLEELKYGIPGDVTENGNGIKAIFNGKDAVPSQYAFTNAPDAEDRAIQAVYFANNWGVDCGEVSALAGKMGDQCRNDMFDKYYKAIGCWKTSGINTQSSGLESQHFLMAWYTSWGGAYKASYGDYSWAWQIGCSHSHQFYQNPLAAYALAYDKNINSGMKATNATADYVKSLQRQIEMYLWLQSADGPFAGGCTNSPNGKYENTSRTGGDITSDVNSTFYDMAYLEHPVYADPGSNHWIGNQVWSTQRLAELYYYVKTKGDASEGQTYGGLSLEDALEALLSRWIDWFLENTKFDYVAEDGTEMAYAIPSSLDWSGSPATWNQKYDPDANSGLHCTITGYGQGDIGCVSSLCNTLIYYAAANKVDAAAAANPNGTERGEKALFLANRLMSAQWNGARDEIGLAYEDHNPNLVRIFEQEVEIPDYYNGTMPDGSKLAPGATFSSIRESYADDEMYQACKEVYDKTGKTDDYYYKLHRFWHMGDALVTTGTMALLYPEVTPLPDGYEPGEVVDQPTTGGEDTSKDGKATLWGDANVDGKVNMADAAAIIQAVGNGDAYPLSEQGAINADIVNNGDGIFGSDALLIQYMVANMITQPEFPVTQEKFDSLSK